MKLIKTRECIHCKKFFDCAGKETDKPCLHFDERERTDNEQVQESKDRS